MTIDIDELLSKGVPVPEKGETLFSSEEDWWHNACLNWCRAPRELYTIGYKEAADLLVLVRLHRPHLEKSQLGIEPRDLGAHGPRHRV